MADNNRVTFARDLGLFDASMIGIGAMIGAGIFVLTGIAAGEAGPAAILAFALNGVVTLLTAFAYAELSSSIPEAGGGYSFVKRAFPGPIGFLSGWMLWFAYTIACSLYALGFSSYFWEFFHKYFPAFGHAVSAFIGDQAGGILITVLICAFFVWLNARGAEVTGKAENVITIAKILVLMVFIYYGLVQIGNEPEAAAANFTPFLPNGFAGITIAMGLTFIAFEGYDLIATVAEEIKEPEKNIPKATFISLGVTIVVYLLILFVALGAVHPEGIETWKFLGENGETAIVLAADSFMPSFGVATIVFGGLLSTMSALNATVLASSRVAFSMGRDRWLPESVATIHPTRRTPHVAIVLTGVILLAVALALPIEIVGSAASLMFLLTFTLVNLALVVLRRKLPANGATAYRVPLFPYVPLAAAVINMALAIYQFNFDPISWFVAIGWIALGLIAYTTYFQKAEKRPPDVIEAVTPLPQSAYRVLVPVANPATVQQLLDLAGPVAQDRNGDVVATAVVKVPIQLPIHEGLKYVERQMPNIDVARVYAESMGCPLSTDVRVAHRVEEGILSAADQDRTDLILMGWKGYTSTSERIFGEVVDRTVHRSNSDIGVVKIRGEGKFERILLPTAGGPHAEFAAELLEPIVKATGAQVTACYVIPPDADRTQEEEAERWMSRTLRHVDLGDVEFRAIRSDSVANGIIKTASDYDLVVLGAAKTGLFQQLLFGEIPDRVGRYAESSVMLVKRHEGTAKRWLRRILN
ncbi:TPA: amino acid transporter [Candidatus Latescibacteria bacterium]|nr:amino acid transporter [Candidatus Latescibacterota bacterium]